MPEHYQNIFAGKYIFYDFNGFNVMQIFQK